MPDDFDMKAHFAFLVEPAGCGRQHKRHGHGLSFSQSDFFTWALVVIAFSGAALLGHYAFSGQTVETLAYLRCFTAGAIICALATDVFPKAYTNNHYLSGVATAVGVVLAVHSTASGSRAVGPQPGLRRDPFRNGALVSRDSALELRGRPGR